MSETPDSLGVDEADALMAVIDGDEDAANRLLGEMASERRFWLAKGAERLAALAEHFEEADRA